MMKRWRDWLRAFRPTRPNMTPNEATEEALRVFPRCC